jgi:hypothetical protein
MGIKHEDVKATGDKGYASEWNKNHTIDSDVDFNGYKPINTGTKYYSGAGLKFEVQEGDFEDFERNEDGTLSIGSASDWRAGIELPDGATITKCVVTASSNDGGWYLWRTEIGTTDEGILAQNTLNTEETTISTPVVDNENYAYHLSLGALSAMTIYNFRIEYTL